MAPLPKRKHSTRRKGKRTTSRTFTFPKLIVCEKCRKLKQSHRVCQYCHQ